MQSTTTTVQPTANNEQQTAMRDVVANEAVSRAYDYLLALARRSDKELTKSA